MSDIVWNAACRAVFVGVQLRASAMPLDWFLLGVQLRHPGLELSLSRLARVDPSHTDVRRRFVAILSDNMAVKRRTGNAQYVGNLRITSRDSLLYDVVRLEHSICTLSYI